MLSLTRSLLLLLASGARLANDASPRPTPAPSVPPSPSTSPSPYSTLSPSTRGFQAVTSVQVRVQGNLPAWDLARNAFVASFGNTFDDRDTAVMDTVNTASVEGALKYVQAECINDREFDKPCERKNSIQYVVFHETTTVQPKAALAEYASDKSVAMGYCPFSPMDGGQCTPSPNGSFPRICDQYIGAHGQPKLGFCVGGELKDQDFLAPYPDTYWFSYPNSCPQSAWKNKTSACREEQAGGLCPYGTKPDGVRCTFSFEILGYIALDDVVGITAMTNPATQRPFTNFTEFCQAGGVEYRAHSKGTKLVLEESISFWKDPSSRDANRQRAQVVVDKYNERVAQSPMTPDGGRMRPLPSIASLRQQNPPCHVNHAQCANAPFGCRRKLYSQICEVCTDKGADCLPGRGCHVVGCGPPATSTNAKHLMRGLIFEIILHFTCSQSVCSLHVQMRLFPCLALTSLALAGRATADDDSSIAASPAPPTRSPSPSWKFQPVKSIKVRVQGNLPAWDAEHQTFITTFGSNFDEKYRAILDTVNMASVEGTFKFVQGECINTNDPLAVANCQRKSNIQYVVFYETVVAQPTAAIDKYQNLDQSIVEHCPFSPMDGGTCSNPTGGPIANICSEYVGSNGQQKLGMCVGGQLADNDPAAPYPDTYWFSFPNSCPSQPWRTKTEQCRQQQPGGMCPYGVVPNGELCTFSFDVLGYIKLDDVVGITSMVNPATNKTYANFSEFCKAGGIEYKASLQGGQIVVEQSIPFWANPSDINANRERVKVLVDKYNALVSSNPKTSDGGFMQPLPSVESLRKANPPCYKNDRRCANAPYGCRRVLYSQICEVCKANDADCLPRSWREHARRPVYSRVTDASSNWSTTVNSVHCHNFTS
ncbi:TPA: hypothetical protein N0F65_003424 [Lagenidium giganteum]|uniref:Uncharacterized protein n=1 Tax=Lagenidium giganteum TaxID=4803 RepID=A0AAV2YHK3_9STRA|nr:TPA: hypothetical protein N0F65_003424 [Lagenidium giganteum]